MDRRMMLKAAATAPLAGLATGSAAAKSVAVSKGWTAQPFVTLHNAEWTKSATIYELNTRQFTPEGTFAAAQKQLPRLKDLGIDIVWLMPIHPIGEKNRKGSLGSPYSVKDYYAVNPEFGTLETLKAFVDAAHALGMHVILDWVANHTAWDNKMATEHPEYYERDWKGDFHPTPWWDWSDIIDLNYDQVGVREHVGNAMVYWVKEAGIDGYRCDVAGYVPTDFWDNVRARLEAIKPVFMLAEWDARDLHAAAFDATYAWGWYNAMHDIAQGKADATALYGYYSGNESAFPREAMRMTFVENHDKNAWEGTQYEAFGDMLPAAIALSVVGEGIPLLHNGQEAGNHKRLEFFEKDTIVWKDDPIGPLYKKLFAYKKANPVLWNGKWGARMVKVENDKAGKIFSFIRRAGPNATDKAVFGVFNFTKEPQTVSFPETLAHGHYTDFDGNMAHIDAATSLTLEPWGWRLFSR